MKRLLLILLLVGCEGGVTLKGDFAPYASTETDPEVERQTDPIVETEEIDPVIEVTDFALSGSDATRYMEVIAQMFIARPISVEERATLESNGYDGIVTVLESWRGQPGFANAMRDMMQNKLKASGVRGEVDFELPGNLVHYIVSHDRPVSELLTAEYCVDGDGGTMPCDTGAPYTAGLLTTRAFLAGNASRFNLTRAATMMNVFACRIYPMSAELQPRANKADLIAMFQAETAEEQTVEEAKDAFGNGDSCYTCHGQFGLHAQLFVKFDETGNYVADADGVQDPSGELGRSLNGLMTSHMEDVNRKGSETSQMFGQDVANLGEAATVLAESDVFYGCMVRNVLAHGFGLTESDVESIREEILESIGERIRDRAVLPTFADLMIETLSDPNVIRVVIPEQTP